MSEDITEAEKTGETALPKHDRNMTEAGTDAPTDANFGNPNFSEALTEAQKRDTSRV